MNNKKHFCLIPWTHLHTWPNGNTYMCCVSDNSKPLGVLSDSNRLSDIWNCDKLKQNRLKLLRDEPLPECSRCYEIERTGGGSMRMDHNFKFKHHERIVEETKEDGTVEGINLPYIDFRFTNFCNLKCRTCGPDLSSKWALDHAILKGEPNPKPIVITPDIDSEIFWSEITSLIPSVERIYFAGGEPLMMEEHYRMLDLLIEHNMTEVEITYNTNFSTLTYKEKNVLEYWNKFSDVTVCASLDSWGSRGEYLRKGLNWNIVENNFRKVREFCPHVSLEIGLTLSIFNFYTLIDYYDYMVAGGFIDYNGMNISIVTDPKWYKPSCIPIEHRRSISEVYKEKLKYLSDNNLCRKSVLDGFSMAINYILSEEENENLDLFKNITKKLDDIRNENIKDIFPELGFLFDE